MTWKMGFLRNMIALAAQARSEAPRHVSKTGRIYAEVESLRARFPGIWTGPP
jgi:hypothetical protein